MSQKKLLLLGGAGNLGNFSFIA